MKVKCDYCGNYIETTSEKCECCDAPNSQYKRTANSQPETIEQLKDWYVAHNLPEEIVTRFFIGKDYRGARAFGIYQDKNGDFVVYKNKSDGKRVERYRGDDETFAVNELYQKLRAEIAFQKARNEMIREEAKKTSVHSVSRTIEDKKHNDKVLAACILCIFLMCMIFAVMGRGHKNGYYRYDNTYYYHYNDIFYYYDDLSDDWRIYHGDFAGDVDDYYVSDSVPSYVDDFKDSATYQRAYQQYLDRQSYDDDDWDSSSSWDSSDSWDSGSTDWSSDW